MLGNRISQNWDLKLANVIAELEQARERLPSGHVNAGPTYSFLLGGQSENLEHGAGRIADLIGDPRTQDKSTFMIAELTGSEIDDFATSVLNSVNTNRPKSSPLDAAMEPPEVTRSTIKTTPLRIAVNTVGGTLVGLVFAWVQAKEGNIDPTLSHWLMHGAGGLAFGVLSMLNINRAGKKKLASLQDWAKQVKSDLDRTNRNEGDHALWGIPREQGNQFDLFYSSAGTVGDDAKLYILYRDKK